jgi:dTDP-4-amino-4,6-dideoxygalactose transaminase
MNRDTVEPFWNTETLAECVRNLGHTQPQQFADSLQDYLGGGKVFLMASGREALREFLARLLPVGSTVLMCSFNCWAVADAALRAGLRVETFDLASPQGGVDWARVASRLERRHGAVLVTHFFGAPSNFQELFDAARATHTIIVEDCAHALGAKLDDRNVGTVGDAAIFSFNHDKPISLAGGGALSINNASLLDRFDKPDCAVTFDEEFQQLSEYLRAVSQYRWWIRYSDGPWKQLQRAMRVAKWLPSQIPTKTTSIGPLRAALGCWQLQRYCEIVQKRNDNAQYLTQGLEPIFWEKDPNTTPAWLRQKVVLPGRDVCRIERHLRRHGLRVGRWNWHQSLEHRLGGTTPVHAAHVAAQGLDVPIHQNMTRYELDMIRSAILSLTATAMAA